MRSGRPRNGVYTREAGGGRGAGEGGLDAAHGNGRALQQMAQESVGAQSGPGHVPRDTLRGTSDRRVDEPLVPTGMMPETEQEGARSEERRER